MTGASLDRAILIRLAVIVIGVMACGRSASADVDYGRYYALVVGINEYEHLPKLETAVNDASAIHDLLAREYGFESRLLLNPSRYEVIRLLDELRAQLTERDNLLVYYSGHGVLDKQTGQGYWLPVDAEEDSQANWIPVHTVTTTLSAMTAKHVLVIADSCYSGTLVREAPVVLGIGAERLTELRRLTSKRARKALTSGGLEPVYDGGGDGHSIFTWSLLEALRGETEVVDGYQLYAEIRRSVVLNSEQTPRYADIRLAGDEGGDFLFVPTRAVAAVEQEPPEPSSVNDDAVEVAYWESVKDSGSPAGLRSYLAEYPDGILPIWHAFAWWSSKPMRQGVSRRQRESATRDFGRLSRTVMTRRSYALISRSFPTGNMANSRVSE